MTAVAKATMIVDMTKITSTASGPDRRGSGCSSAVLKALQVSHAIAAAWAIIQTRRCIAVFRSKLRWWVRPRSLMAAQDETRLLPSPAAQQ